MTDTACYEVKTQGAKESRQNTILRQRNRQESVDEILDYAIDQEQQAADFYASVAARADKPGMKKMLLEFAGEEKHHKERLLAVKTGELKLTRLRNPRVSVRPTAR